MSNLINDLRNKISEANKAYRNGNSIMSDIEWDSLLEQFQKLVPENEFNAFRQTLMEKDGKIVHPYSMGSLEKFKHEDPSKLYDWMRKHVKNSLNISAKVDGISCRLHFSNGQLVSGTTRGDGHRGEDISDKILFVKHIPHQIDLNGEIDVRGELVMLTSDFEEVSEKFANPRNAVAGLINRKDWNEKEISAISFVAYTIFGNKYTKKEQFDILEHNNFFTAWHKSIQFDILGNFSEFNEKLKSYAKQEFLYGTDGLVISDDEYRNEDVLIPEGQIAYKINELTAETTVIAIDWRGPSKDGKFVPVAQLEPVTLGGSTISQCTLHNLDFIEKMNIKYGSRISLLKSGDIVPRCVSLIENPSNAVDIVYPTHCDSCSEELIRDGVDLRCVNPNCSAKQLSTVASFIKKFDVKHSAKKQLDNFGIKTIDDLIAFLPNQNYKSEVTFYNEICSKVFTASPKKIFCAMNFKGLAGIQLAKIVDAYSLDWILSLKYLDSEKEAMYQKLPVGIGEKSIEVFWKYLPDAIANTQKIMNDSRYNIVMQNNNEVVKNDISKGSICFTGTLETMGRKQAQELATAAGFEVKNGVNKGLTYLVMADPNSNSSKARKAREFGTKCISEKEFLTMCKNEQQNLEDL